MYIPLLKEKETEHAIKLIKDTFQSMIATSLKLRRVTAPLFVQSGMGINDDLNGVEQPVRFVATGIGVQCEIVHSLAKWKRMKLAEMNEQAGYGIYTDMNAIRTAEELDELHSLYVDQWDWEKVITPTDRTTQVLREHVQLIYQSLLNTEYIVSEHYPEIFPFLPKQISFITAEELLQRYPTLTAKERENAIAKEMEAIFIQGIGNPLSNGEVHDHRAPDYDDWTTVDGNAVGLNGDILIWYEPLQRAVEISSMGVRVNKEALEKQLALTNHEDWKRYAYHNAILHDRLPLTIGGGIGQSRLCMLLLHKMHIGEVQASVWAEQMINDCKNNGINILK
ncbi:MAG: aspartate--ammonia ligase [Paludibacteraceae bacterium]|nr:aspartate--ammonia ligase [Paludibacteraceae bacterium]